MKLKNKKTGEIVEFITGDTFEMGGIQIRSLRRNPQIVRRYNSLAELDAEWEDYKEPKQWWYIDIAGEVKQGEGNVPEHLTDGMKQIGNRFEAEEKAEKAVEKLKAWKRLEDKGLRFDGWLFFPDSYHPSQERVREGNILFKVKNDKEVGELLDTVFGGEE